MRVKAILADNKVYDDIQSALETLQPIAICLDIVGFDLGSFIFLFWLTLVQCN